MTLRAGNRRAGTPELIHSRDYYKLYSDVVVVPRSNHIVLTRRDRFGAVRVGRDFGVLVELLRAGATRAALEQRLCDIHGRCFEASSLIENLRRLEWSGLIEGKGRAGSFPRTWTRRWICCNVDSLAKSIAKPLQALGPTTRRAVALALTGTSVIALAWHVSRLEPPLGEVATGFIPIPDLLGVVTFLIVVIPVHELAHAVACRLAGHAVGPAGLLLYWSIVPGPFVDTSNMYAEPTSWSRCMVALAGPFTDLLFAGASAGALLLLDSTDALYAPLSTLTALSVALVVINMNPLSRSDGSRALEALLDDDLARRAAAGCGRVSLSTKRTMRLYRLACAAYLGLLVLLPALLWWLP